MLLSDMLKGGQTLQGKAGPLAIAANDLLELNAIGQLNTVNVADYAAVANQATAIVAQTVVSASFRNSNNGRSSFVNPADLSYFIATTPAGGAGLSIYKYSITGALLATTALDAASAVSNAVSIAQLSNGNLAVTWGLGSGALGNIKFAILDINLNIIVAATTITSSAAYDNSNNTFSDMIALSGGGFAIAWSGTSNVQLNIYTNTGTSTYSGAISGSPASVASTSMCGPRLTQLSNGNIAAAITSTVASQALGHAIVTAAGASVVAYSVLDAASLSTGPTVIYAEISSLSGFYCTVIGDGANLKAYVLSNAGAIQGTAYTLAYAYTPTQFKVTNDGANFWAHFASGSAPASYVVFIPTSGSGYVQTKAAASGSLGNGSMYWEKGVLVNGVGIYNASSSGTVSLIVAASTIGITSPLSLRLIGDFAVLYENSPSSNSAFTIIKYLNTAIVGVAQQAVAAGNAGTAITFSHGGGVGKNGYPINAILGTIGKGFNHSAANIIGNTGTLLGSSVGLEGII